MSYKFNGRLCGYLCADCVEPLANVSVRIYRTDPHQPVTALAVARTKDTFQLLGERQVDDKRGRLMGEFATDADGNFSADLSTVQGYGGEAFEVDVYCGTVPGRPPTPKMPAPQQFTVTVVQPQWRRSEQDAVAVWSECLSHRHWCSVRAKFGAWAICGHVTVCDGGQPVPGVKVSAFDRDWLQDDALGSAFTDATGKFRIDYLDSDFRKDIFGFNIELFGGPDLYFRVDTPSGTVLLQEPASRGRAPDRENVGPCVCVDLCVREAPVVTHAWFTRVGDFGIYSDINHLTDGLTSHAVPFGFPGAHGGPGFAFYGGLKLVGDVPANYPTGGPLMRYRFLTQVAGGAPEPVTAARLIAVKVGTRPIVWNVSGTPAPVVTAQDIYVAPFGNAPGAVAPPTPTPALPMNVAWGPIPPAIMVPDANGWVPVDPSATNGGFSGPLLRLDSNTVVPGGAAPDNGAGVAVAAPRSGALVWITFEAEPVGGASLATPTLGNALENLRVNNWSDVNRLSIAQFTGAGNTPCSGLSTALDIDYTTDHEFMRGWSLGISTSAPQVIPPLPSGPDAMHPRGAFGRESLDISAWPACSYLVTLSTQRKLTDGETDDPGHTSVLTFCKD